MTRARAVPRFDRSNADGGFTLIEVVVALFLLGVVATAVLVFFIKGVQTTAHLQRDQAADGIAVKAMEDVQTISAQAANGAGTPILVVGRSATTVAALWAKFPSDVAQMNPLSDPAAAVWDPASGTPDPATIPDVTTVDLVNGSTHIKTTYTVTTLIGYCWRVASATAADESCTQSDPGGAAKVFRTVIIVSWKPTSSGQCGGAATCEYRLTGLMDPTKDASWNITTNPVAYDDVIKAVAGTSTITYEILSNDVIGAVTSNPTILLTNPSMGTASVITSGASMGMLNYTPPANASGQTQLTYMLRDAAGRTSNTAKVVITIVPAAVNDAASVYRGQSVAINVAANDLGTFGAGSVVAITSPPTSGSVSVSGTTVTYNAPSTGSSASFAYTITDPNGQTSNAATVNITLLTPVVPTAQDLAISMPATATTRATDLNLLNLTSNDATSKVFVVSGPTAASGWSSVGSLAGSGSSSVTYTPVVNSVGVYTFTYYVQSASGAKSATKTVTLSVVPVATNDAMSVRRNTSNNTYNVGTNDIPTTGNGMTYAMTGKSGSVCGTVNINASTGLATYSSTSSSTGTCSVTYTLSKSAGATTLTSNTGTLVVTVTR